MVLSEYARLRTINWLNGMQSSGAFDGFDEENMDFESLSNEDIRYYFIEWYFTEPDEEVEDEPELILERQRILFSEQDSKRLYGLYDLQLKGLKAQYVADSYDDMVEQGQIGLSLIQKMMKRNGKTIQMMRYALMMGICLLKSPKKNMIKCRIAMRLVCVRL